MNDEEIMENMVEGLMMLGYPRERAIEEVNDCYLTKLIYEPDLN